MVKFCQVPVARGLVWISPRTTDGYIIFFFPKANFRTAGWTDNKKKRKKRNKSETETGHLSLTFSLFLLLITPSCSISTLFSLSPLPSLEGREDDRRGILCCLASVPCTRHTEITTKWKRAVCSGSSVCRTRCWHAGGRGPSPRSPAASEPAAAASWHPSEPGSGSESEQNQRGTEWSVYSMWTQKQMLMSMWRAGSSSGTHLPSHHRYLLMELSSVKTWVFLKKPNKKYC